MTFMISLLKKKRCFQSTVSGVLTAYNEWSVEFSMAVPLRSIQWNYVDSKIGGYYNSVVPVQSGPSSLPSDRRGFFHTFSFLFWEVFTC